MLGIFSCVKFLCIYIHWRVRGYGCVCIILYVCCVSSRTCVAPSCFCMWKLDVWECMVRTHTLNVWYAHTHSAPARPIIILTRSIQQLIPYIHYLAVALSPALPYARFFRPLTPIRYTHTIHAGPSAFLFFSFQKIYTDLRSLYLSVSLSVSLFDSPFHSLTYTQDALDLSPFYLAASKKLLNKYKGVTYVEAAAEDVPSKDKSYDIVTCVYLFHELPQVCCSVCCISAKDKSYYTCTCIYLFHQVPHAAVCIAVCYSVPAENNPSDGVTSLTYLPREVGGWGRIPFSRNLMSPTPRRKWYLTTGRRFH